MNKSIKRAIAIGLAVSAFAVIEPVKYSNIMTESVYADDNIYLKGISVTDGDDIELSSSKKTYKTNVPNSSEDVIIRVITNDKDDKVTIDGDSDIQQISDKKYSKTVKLDKGNNSFDITVKSEDGDKEREYTLKIDRGGKQSNDSDSVFLSNINVDYGNVDFSKEKTTYDLNVDDDVDKLRVQANPENDNYIVRIDGIKVDDDDKFRKEVSLSKGANTILIDVEDDEDDDNTKEYTLNVYRGKASWKGTDTSSSNVNFDNKQDEIYLDEIVLDDGDTKFTPGFNKKITSYSADVPEDTDSVIVKAESAYGSDIVKINGVTLRDTNRKRISLSKGKNVIELQVNTDCDEDEDDYEKRVYKITVYRGTSEGTSATGTNTNSQKNTAANTNANNAANTSSTNTNKAGQWTNVNGKWQCTDSAGNLLKNTWYYDQNYGKTYYFDQDGNMATGWKSYNGSWYYLELNGARTTGWKQLGANWYYFDNEGKMKTGWLKDTNGKWYYLYYTSGVMATNTTIDQYTIGPDGAML